MNEHLSLNHVQQRVVDRPKMLVLSSVRLLKYYKPIFVGCKKLCKHGNIFYVKFCNTSKTTAGTETVTLSDG